MHVFVWNTGKDREEKMAGCWQHSCSFCCCKLFDRVCVQSTKLEWWVCSSTDLYVCLMQHLSHIYIYCVYLPLTVTRDWLLELMAMHVRRNARQWCRQYGSLQVPKNLRFGLEAAWLRIVVSLSVLVHRVNRCWVIKSSAAHSMITGWRYYLRWPPAALEVMLNWAEIICSWVSFYLDMI